MRTHFWSVDSNVDNLKSCPQIQQASECLRQNEVVAFPTETVYGLGANACSDAAVKKIFQAKGRPSDNPLIVHVATMEQLYALVDNVQAMEQKLIDLFWPGPLTIIFKNQGKLSTFVTAGLDTVGIRMPNHPVALALIEASGLPIAAPSANTSGKPSPTTAMHVKDDLDGKIAGILDGGMTGVGVESTVIECTSDQIVILRPGGITKEQLEAASKVKVVLDRALTDQTQKPKAPGMKYTHYAPNAPLILVNGSPHFLQTLVDNKRLEGLKVGILTTEERKNEYHADVVLACGRRADLTSVNHHLYDCLRQFNMKAVDIIYSEMFEKSGAGLALMNRLEKAAGHQIINE